jgi:PAS domain S-box-containing protein
MALALARDITNRKEAEAALRASEEQYRAMFNAAIDGVALWTAEGELVDTNPALWHMYGYGDDDSSLSGRWAGPAYATEFLRSVAAGESRHIEVTELRKDGVALEIELHGIPMRYQGKPHVLTIARDVTEKKRSATELARQRERSTSAKLAALGRFCRGCPRTQQSAVGCRGAGRLAEERGDPATQVAAQKIRVAAALRAHRAHVPRHGRQQPPERGPVIINDVDSGAGHHRLRYPHQQHRRDAGPRARHSSNAGRRRPAPPGAAQPHHQRAAVAAGAAAAATIRVATEYLAAPDMIRIIVATMAPASLRTCGPAIRTLFHDQAHGHGPGRRLAVSLARRSARRYAHRG